MENQITPVGKDTSVAVAVKKGSISQAALKWAIENLLTEGSSVTLVHVRPQVIMFNKTLESGYFQVDSFAGPDVRNAIDNGFKDILEMRAREMLSPFQSYCKRKKVQCEIVILESDNVVVELSDFVLGNNIDVLVMGTKPRSRVVKTLLGPQVTSRVSKRIPYFCTLYAVYKGKLQFVKNSSLVSQRIPEKDEDFVRNIDLETPLAYCKSPVSSRTGLLRSDASKEIEFKSPLKDYRLSDFSVGGSTASDLDISFVDSYSQFSDVTSNSWSTYSSGWSSDTSDTRASVSTNNSDWNKWSSGSVNPLLWEYRDIDELHRLRLEMINSRSKYTTCDEDDELILASKLNAINVNEDERMKMMQKPQNLLSGAEGRRSPTTASMTDINQAVGKEESLNKEDSQDYNVHSDKT